MSSVVCLNTRAICGGCLPGWDSARRQSSTTATNASRARRITHSKKCSSWRPTEHFFEWVMRLAREAFVAVVDDCLLAESHPGKHPPQIARVFRHTTDDIGYLP